MTTTAHILVVEDDPSINGLLVRLLQRAGYQATPSFSGTEALLRLEQGDYDLILLDLMLPGLDGASVLQRLRETHALPVIVISARGDVVDRVELLRLGADDYIVKPFDVDEVLARVEAQLRRCRIQTNGCQEAAADETLHYKQLRIERAAHRAMMGETKLELTSREYQILYLLVEHPGRVFTREAIYQAIWPDDVYVVDNTINVHISNLRAKFARHDDAPYIETVWGIGFILAD